MKSCHTVFCALIAIVVGAQSHSRTYNPAHSKPREVEENYLEDNRALAPGMFFTSESVR